MIKVSEKFIAQQKNNKYIVYSTVPLAEGIECFSNNSQFNKLEYYVTAVEAKHIRHSNGKFYFTNEDLSEYSDYYPAHVMPLIGNFTRSSRSKAYKCTSLCKDGKKLASDKCIIDVSGIPAFGIAANEDQKIHEYRIYNTLFNDYNFKQCRYYRHELYDTKIKSSKFDLEAKVQNSNFLKSKDFKVINVSRQNEEVVKVGLVLRENEATEYGDEYGVIYLDMNNQISIKWH